MNGACCPAIELKLKGVYSYDHDSFAEALPYLAAAKKLHMP